MALTGLKTVTDRDEYSRFEPSRSKVRVRVVPTPATNLVNEAVTVSLKRGNGLLMSSQEISYNGNYPKGQIVEFDLPAIVDEDGIPLCIRGDYYIEAVQGVVTGRADITISIITVDELKANYCMGLPLLAAEVLTARKQPEAITGITIKRVSDRTRPGFKTLVYTNTGKTLSYDGGAAIPLTGRNEILPGPKGDYIEIDVDDFDLPAADASEAVLIDKELISDETIRGEIRRAVDEIENAVLKVNIEPMRIATEPYFSSPETGKWYDEKAEPLAYYNGDFNLNGLAWHLNLPVQQLIKVEKLQGYMGNTKVLDIGSGALVPNRKSGTVDVLPYNSQYAYLYTFLTQVNFFGFREFIAGFWRYAGKAGIEKMEGDLLKYVGYVAAIPLLTKAGIAARAGKASESTSKDGVSHSSSVNSAGLYASATTEYKGWIEKNTDQLRKKYRGISMVTL